MAPVLRSAHSERVVGWQRVSPTVVDPPGPDGSVDDSHTRRVAGGAIVSLAGGAISFVLSIGYQIVMARRLGPSGFGVFVLALAIARLLAEASDLGLDYGILRLGSIAHGQGSTARLRAVLRDGIVGALVAGTVAGLGLAATASLVAGLFHKGALASVLVPLALTVPFIAGTDVMRSGLRAMGDAVGPVASSSIVGPTLRLGTGAWAVTAAPSAAAAAWAYLATEVALFVITALMLWRRVPRPDGHEEEDDARGLFRFSLPMSLNRILLYSNNQTEIVLLGILTPSATVGIFSVSRRLSVLVGSLLSSVSILFNPVVADLHHSHRTDELRDLFRASTRWLLTLALPVCLVELLFARQILAVMGPAFIGGDTALMILAAGQLVNVGTGTTSNLQAMAGYAKVTLLNSLLFLSMSIALDLALIPPFGLLGAAIANTSSLVVVNVLRLWQIRRRLGMMPYDRTFLRPLAAAVPAAVAGLLVPTPGAVPEVELAVRTLVVGVVYLVALLALGLEPGDREIARSALRRVRDRVMTAPASGRVP